MSHGDWRFRDLVFQEIQANYHGLTEDELADRFGQMAKSELRRLYNDGRFKRDGAGVKRDPYRYHLGPIKMRV
jgi:hypothetical protein